MQEIIVSENEAGQRFDKYLFKYLKEAPSGFIYKMLRKKNIVLNSKKSDGKDKLKAGDSIKIFMSDETIGKFRGENRIEVVTPVSLDIIYEDDHVIIVNKPSGILSQKADKKDISINEQIIAYLIETGKLTREQLNTFKPGVCNRLDRNTSGLIVAGKSLKGSQVMSQMFKERTMDKYYIAIVSGQIENKMKINGFLAKNEKTNKVSITEKELPGSQFIETAYEPMKTNGKLTVLKVKLITGRSHQIRAHLASIGHPLIGDYKYGDKKVNDFYKKNFQIESQMLHAWKLVFHQMPEEWEGLSEKEMIAPLPKEFEAVIGSKL